MAKKKRSTTANRGAADLAARFIAHAKRMERKANIAAEELAPTKAYQSLACGVALAWNNAAEWMSQWDTRAQAKPGGLGRKRKVK